MTFGMVAGSWFGVMFGYIVTGNADFSLPCALGVTACAIAAHFDQ